MVKKTRIKRYQAKNKFARYLGTITQLFTRQKNPTSQSLYMDKMPTFQVVSLSQDSFYRELDEQVVLVDVLITHITVYTVKDTLFLH